MDVHSWMYMMYDGSVDTGIYRTALHGIPICIVDLFHYKQQLLGSSSG